jgi:hypothetical protein
MPAAPPTDLSPVAAVAAILGVILGPAVLPFASAYAVIGAGALVGAMIGLFRRAPCSPLASVTFVLVVIVAAMGVTVPIAQWIAGYLNQPVTWLVFPVSLAVAAVGEDWLKLPFGELAKAAFSRIKRAFGGPSNGTDA